MEYEPTDSSGLMAVAGTFFVVYLAIIVVMVASMWKIFTKAGKPGWAAIVPIYNLVVLLEIVNKPVWWILLFFIPFVNFIMAIILAHKLSESFGQGIGMTIALILFIGYPILAFGSATYQGSAARSPQPI